MLGVTNCSNPCFKFITKVEARKGKHVGSEAKVPCFKHVSTCLGECKGISFNIAKWLQVENLGLCQIFGSKIQGSNFVYWNFLEQSYIKVRFLKKKTYNTSYEHLKSWEWSWQNDSWPCNPLIKGSIKSLVNWEAYLWWESIFQRLQFCHWELPNQRHNKKHYELAKWQSIHNLATFELLEFQGKTWFDVITLNLCEKF